MAGNNYSDDLVYNSRPYHALYISDDEGEDDDICVWPEMSDYDSVDEPLGGHFRQLEIDTKGQQPQNTKEPPLTHDNPPEQAESTESIEAREEIEIPKTTPANTSVKRAKQPSSQVCAGGISSSEIDPKTGKLTEEAFREREIQYALSTARRSLTHMSQFVLKLEARAGKTTKEGIRQTLDATVSDMQYDFSARESDYKTEIEAIKDLSNELYHRLYLVDKHWRRIARDARKAGEQGSGIRILSDTAVKEWIRREFHANYLAAEETCFYTVQDLVSHRSFSDWVFYLRDLCGFKDHPHDEQKLVELAWRFLDRNLRGSRPVNPTSVRQFIAELDEKCRSGVWDGVKENPKKQEMDDKDAWRLMRRYWSSRMAPS
ncbi:hypothetical protein F5B22DRAFT_657904 [Xylaria bambusicola]|uniref:uncharacterized protein n=1 Tax=Xylaria bambusicola TaxID=326684 RepID=UPI002008CC18|nr:uncharacterized protein F5B22DRAFT_657904 [Xylaria bambusicola]KAI0509711.1 hypothetical protein F5B22DRAFT_657904 [Xylaria bambusicola]